MDKHTATKGILIEMTPFTEEDRHAFSGATDFTFPAKRPPEIGEIKVDGTTMLIIHDAYGLTIHETEGSGWYSIAANVKKAKAILALLGSETTADELRKRGFIGDNGLEFPGQTDAELIAQADEKIRLEEFYKARVDLLGDVERLRVAFEHLNRTVDRYYGDEDEGFTNAFDKAFPFQLSFDELTHAVQDWEESVRQTVKAQF